MAKEIERKFLVRGTAWRDHAGEARSFRQAYLSRLNQVSIRVRVVDGARAMLTVKSGERLLSRDEYEYDIPVADADELLLLRQGAIVEKTRHKIRRGDLTWEVDVFTGANEGLVLAEIELDHEDQPFDRPEWLGHEVTGEARYYSASLATSPLRSWPPELQEVVGFMPGS